MAKIKILTLDARENSSLSWDYIRPEALGAIASGHQLLWNLDLGLFQHLTKPLTASAQFLTLGLALDHFKNTIWKEFHRFSLGVSLYEGAADFLPQLRWDDSQKNNFQAWLQERVVEDSLFTKQLFARDVSAEYLEQLAGRLPDEIQPYVIFDKLPEDALLTALFTDPERYGRITLYTTFKWKTAEQLSLGICMPPLSAVNPNELDPLKKILIEIKHDYKLISESALTNSWDGLDTLIYLPDLLSPQGARKIKGFVAAGGSVITANDWLESNPSE